jgi:choline-sulfatase
MIKRDNLKYQYYGGNMPEVLFDLEKDPRETKNFIDDPGYTQQLTYFRNYLSEILKNQK